jgi:hypothetical protein
VAGHGGGGEWQEQATAPDGPRGADGGRCAWEGGGRAREREDRTERTRCPRKGGTNGGGLGQKGRLLLSCAGGTAGGGFVWLGRAAALSLSQ